MIMAITGVHCAFAAETIIKTSEPVIAKPESFRDPFMLRWNDVVPERIFNPL